MKAFDQRDRRLVGGAFVIVLAFLLACISVGASLGAGVLAFRLVSGW